MPRKRRQGDNASPPAGGGRLDRYREMRDFARTPEPDGTVAPPGDGRPRFVVQEHHARALHWDFRLERDGVLVSWAVPRGIPADAAENHLAVHTGDHPLAYMDFQGEIADGNYGAGAVTIWDRGTYEEHKFRDDEVMVTLHGARVAGKYVLFRTDGKNWMLHRMDPPQDPARESMPKAIAPMLARLAKLPAPEQDANYAYEVKWDGIRVVAYISGGRLKLLSRSQRDITAEYPELGLLGETLGSREVVLDGEIVLVDEAGRPNFGRLQGRIGVSKPADARRRAERDPVTFMLFDILYLDGRSTMALPYPERRRLLEGLGLDAPRWKTPAYHVGDGEAMFAASANAGLEGVMAKRLDSPYQPGQRTRAWLKVKNALHQDVVIGGWQEGEGRRAGGLGSLLVGYYDLLPDDAEAQGRTARLVYAGGVGTGFTDRLLDDLLERLAPLERPTSPFAPGPRLQKGSRYVEPALVAEVRFLEWTQTGQLRFPVFRTLKEGGDPHRVLREEVALPDERATEVPGNEDATLDSPTDAPDIPAHGKKVDVTIDGRRLTLSNLDKVLYPAYGFTKAEVLEYYLHVAPVLIPHLAGRPMTLKRHPDGVDQPFFYERQCPSHRPAWVRTAPIFSRENGRTIDYCLVNDRATLLWLANLASIELHPSLSLATAIGQPSSVVFDLDPGAPAGLRECAKVALWLRDALDALGLESVVKTSGSKGMQVYIPLNTETSYTATKPFARALALVLAKQHPELVVSSMTKAVRTGKVLIDWSQNDQHKTTIAVYSLRARPQPSVATPVTWDEVARAARPRSKEPVFLAREVLRRLDTLGDLLEPMLSLRQHLPMPGATTES